MSEVSNSDLMNVLLGVKQDIGAVKADLINHALAFNRHLVDDAKLSDTVRQLEITGAKAAGKVSGKRSAFAVMGSVIGALCTLAVDYLFRK